MFELDNFVYALHMDNCLNGDFFLSFLCRNNLAIRSRICYLWHSGFTVFPRICR
mgnify:CR=1 FL=1